MDTRRQRFFAAVSLCQARINETLSNSEQSNLTGWEFSKATHPLDDNKLAIAEHPMTLHGEFDSANPQVRFTSTLILSAVRLASTTEVSAGIRIRMYGSQTDMRNSILDAQSQTGLVYCYETAPAYKETAQIRVAWKFHPSTTKDDVAYFRAIPRVHLISECLLFLEEQMTQTWADGESSAPAHESALSGRTAALANGDKLAVSIPWIHHDHYLLAEVNLSKLIHALTKLNGLVAP